MQKAFTLIELLVVVLIIGILVAVALPQYEKAVLKSRLNNCKVLVNAILKAEQVFYEGNNEYAVNPDSLDVQLPEPTSRTYNESIDRTVFYYPWGECQYHAGEGIGCFNTVSGIGYQAGLTGRRECKSSSSCTMCRKVCQAETGKNTTDYDDGGFWVSYFYP